MRRRYVQSVGVRNVARVRIDDVHVCLQWCVRIVQYECAGRWAMCVSGDVRVETGGVLRVFRSVNAQSVDSCVSEDPCVMTVCVFAFPLIRKCAGSDCVYLMVCMFVSDCVCRSWDVLDR